MKYACAICGRKREADRMIFSRYTRKRYCKTHMLKPARRKAHA